MQTNSKEPLFFNSYISSMGNIIKNCAIIFFVGAVILVSGCISHSADSPNASALETSLPQATSDIISHAVTPVLEPNQPAPNSTIKYPPDPSHWIQIDTIQNFQTDPTDSANLSFNITGTTNLPVNSLLFIEPYRKDFSTGDDERALISNVVVKVENNRGKINTFSYRLETSAGPGEYRVVVRRGSLSNSTGFTILGKDPLPWLWIRIDPIGNRSPGETFNITGTTDLPTGSEISVTGDGEIHPCPVNFTTGIAYPNEGTFCNPGCDSGYFSVKIPVVNGKKGYNTWTLPVNTTGWCKKERYAIGASKKEWDNVSSASEEFGFRTP
jgi:hypothetical protein